MPRVLRAKEAEGLSLAPRIDYPDEWFDGRWRLFTQADIGTLEAAAFRQSFRQHAHRRGMKSRTTMNGEGICCQAIPKESA